MAVTLFAESKPTKSGREDFQTSGSLRSDVIPGSRITLFGSRRLPKISQAEIVHLTTQLAIMLRSGVDLTSALESLARQVEQDLPVDNDDSHIANDSSNANGRHYTILKSALVSLQSSFNLSFITLGGKF